MRTQRRGCYIKLVSTYGPVVTAVVVRPLDVELTQSPCWMATSGSPVLCPPVALLRTSAPLKAPGSLIPDSPIYPLLHMWGAWSISRLSEITWPFFMCLVHLTGHKAPRSIHIAGNGRVTFLSWVNSAPVCARLSCVLIHAPVTDTGYAPSRAAA